MGFADGFYYGQGKIIVDTTNLLATDIVRVRSMTTPTKVWNKTVTTPGGYMVFEVPGKDYYKISLVQEQEISGETVEVEVVNVFETLGYGEVKVVNVLNKTTLAGIQAILNAHSESILLNLGDEVLVNVAGSYKPYVIVAINLYETHEVILGWKYTSAGAYNVGNLNFNARTEILNYLDTRFNSIDEADRQFIKDKLMKFYTQGGPYTCTRKLWIPSKNEAFGSQSSESPMLQFPYFTTSEHRQTYVEDTSNIGGWQLSSSTLDWSAAYADIVGGNGGLEKGASTRIRDFFHLTADV